MSSLQPPQVPPDQPPQVPPELEHRLDLIDDHMNHIRRQSWWDLGIVTAIISAIISLAVFFVLNNFQQMQSERDALRSKVGTLQQEASDLPAMRDLVSQYSALTTYALQQNELSQQEVIRFVRGTPGLTPTGQLRTAQITDPAEHSQVKDGTIVRGIINSFKIAGATLVSSTCWTAGCSESLSPSERTIWIVTQPVAINNRFYPQGSWFDNAGPVLINAAGEWVSPVVFMGATPSGTPILIHAMLVSHKGEDVFKAYLEKGAATGRFAGLTWSQLPAGVEILDTVMVFPK